MDLTFELPPEFLARFRIVGPLGEGGMGTVYRAVQLSLDRSVAIKFLTPNLATPDFLARFEAEARLAARVFHSNLVAVIESGLLKDRPYIVFELVEGSDLRQILREAGGPLPLQRALDLVRQAAEGLQCAHTAGIIHRDVKPENLLVTGDCVLKVGDFGVARGTRSADASSTQAGVIVGTPLYMSPEQVRQLPVTPATDVYSLCVVLQELITGCAPFTGESVVDILHHQMHSPPPPLPDEVPAGVVKLLARGLAKASEDRFENMAELARELARVRASLSVEELQTTSRSRHSPTARVATLRPPQEAAATQISAAPPPPVRSAPRLIVIGLAAALALGGVSAHVLRRPQPEVLAATHVAAGASPAPEVEEVVDFSMDAFCARNAPRSPEGEAACTAWRALCDARLADAARIIGASLKQRGGATDTPLKKARDQVIERLQWDLLALEPKDPKALAALEACAGTPLTDLVGGILALNSGDAREAARRLDAFDNEIDAHKQLPNDINSVRPVMTLARLIHGAFNKDANRDKKINRTIRLMNRFLSKYPRSVFAPLSQALVDLAEGRATGPAGLDPRVAGLFDEARRTVSQEPFVGPSAH